MRKRKFLLVITSVLALLALLAACATPTPQVIKETVEVPVTKKIKAAWIYVGPIGDYGWTHAHDLGRKYVQDKFGDWLDTVYAESVPEADAARYIDRFIQEEKADVVFTTSFGYMDATIEAGNKYPDKIFFHCSGYKRAKNVGTYFAEFYQLYYLNGLMAGALTKTGKVGYVAAHPIPEVVRHINAFALGVREVNPDATVDVRWLFSWYDPAKAREAAEALISEGVDVLAFTEDSPAVVEVGEEYATQKGKPIYTFAHYSPMLKYGPHSAVSGQLVHWEKIYEDILTKIYIGVYTNENLENVDYWWMLREGAVELGADFGVPINPEFEDDLKAVKVKDPILGEISVYDLVFKRLEQMSEETVLFDPFTGPIKDQDGNLRIEAGRRASHDELWTIDWFVEGIVARIPR
ncbi:MAG: BMP family ABC transporter substrate-binding protein [Chloroflexi bacterium]|nr:MAG: BMP family ABC transporter substrate-binding protein [Chloroflexota bacterium]HDN80840.1 BMP family ABC transporter substrate-binding protein [Chloroflexota bacterium]